MQAANVLMGPFKILSFGVGMITIPDIAALMHRAPKKALQYCVAASIGMSALGALWTVALLMALPLGVGHLMLGSLWGKAYPLVLPTALTVLSGCAGSGASTGLHAMGAAKRSLRVALTTAAISLSLALAGALLGSMLITLYFVAAANWMGAVLSWLQLRVAMHETGTLGSGGRHRKPGTADPPASGFAENAADTPATGIAVSGPAPAGSYGRQARQATPQVPRPGEETS